MRNKVYRGVRFRRNWEFIVRSEVLSEYRIWRDINEGCLEGEVWKTYPSNEFYEISSLGRVRSNCNRALRSGHKFWQGKIIAQHSSKKNVVGYLRVKMSGINSPVAVHRAVAETFIPNPEGKPQVNHINGVKTDNKVENLEWVTAKENTNHADATGLRNHPTGEFRDDVVYNGDIVRKILNLYFYDLKTYKEIESVTGVIKEYVALIVKGKRWVEVFNTFIDADREYCVKAKQLLTKRRNSNRDKVEEKVRDLKKLA